jgi:pSer/pThr/pTyr-binding forkhead associated (FHA) protein
MKLTLVRIDHPTSREPIEIDSSTVIGSSSDARIRLDDNDVSSFHCAISRCRNEFVVRDLGSARGTFLNGYRVRESVLRHGDRVSVGRSMFRAQLRRTTH